MENGPNFSSNLHKNLAFVNRPVLLALTKQEKKEKTKTKQKCNNFLKILIATELELREILIMINAVPHVFSNI